MAPNKVLVLSVFFCLLSSLLLLCASSEPESQFQRKSSIGRRKMLDLEDDEVKPLPKIKKPTTTTTTTTSSTKNQTKPLKPKSNLSTKNQTKPITQSTSSSTNSTKLQKVSPSSSSSSSSPPLLPKTKTELKKLNSTKKLSPSSSSSSSSSSDLLLKPATPKNKTKTSKPTSNLNSDQKTQKTTQSTDKTKPTKPIIKPTTPSSIWLDEFEEDDLVSGFRDLPNKFQQTLIPDLERISTTSKIYIDLANKEMTRGFKPIVGKRYASTIASIVSFAFITIPLLLVSLIFNRIKSYFSLQKLLIFVQIYLSIYFSILCLSTLVTGLEPLRFFYATSLSTYVCLQILQTLCYVFYLLILIMYLLVVFSTDCGLGPKLLGLAQTVVGLAVGLHYYVSVFHRVVLHQPPRTNWKVHGIYATCFLVICLLAQAERRKKAYLEEGGEEGKKS